MRARTKRRLGIVCVVVGTGTIAVAATGSLAGWGKQATSTTTTTTASIVPTTSTTLPLTEDPAQFLDALGTALRAGDLEFLMSRLHPATIERYLEIQCRTTLAGQQDGSAQFGLVSVSEPADFEWTTDDRTVVIPDTLSVEVDRVEQGVTSRAVIHITPANGQFTWFVDCGNPFGP
ncbi:MAG TPA: hypothetical protein VFF40_13705 [Acidimicrobiia bacterium]|nr:hypothetical protein [Acidimicrobiia bacterium]